MFQSYLSLLLQLWDPDTERLRKDLEYQVLSFPADVYNILHKIFIIFVVSKWKP